MTDTDGKIYNLACAYNKIVEYEADSLKPNWEMTAKRLLNHINELITELESSDEDS